MIDFEQARVTMVDRQVRPNSVTDHDVLRAFLEVPREEFVAPKERPLAYIDEDLPLSGEGEGRYLMECMSLAKLVQLADIGSDNIVLDVGCATGYSSAIISRLCNSVVALESDAALADQATETLMRLGFANVAVVCGPLPEGYAQEAPYDVIFVGGALESSPEKLLGQLKDGGRLVCVEGRGNTGVAKLYMKFGDVVSHRREFNCAVTALPGFETERTFQF